MLNDHRTWRYFEPIEIEPGRPELRRPSPQRNTTLIDALRQEIQVLRRSLDLVIDENETLFNAYHNRLPDSVLESRRATAQGRVASRTRGSRRATLAQVDSTEEQSTYLQDPRVVWKNSGGETTSMDAASHGIHSNTRPTVSTIDELSRVVVRWVFPASSEPRVRMVAAAIRNRLAPDG